MIITTDKQLRPRDPADFYPTPLALCRAALALLPLDIRARPDWQEFIIDPGAGIGVWGKAARERWPGAEISGCDIRDLPQPPDYNQWIPKWDWVKQAVGGNADLIMGNPPFREAEEFIVKGMRFLRPRGYQIQLLRLAFLEGQARSRGLWKWYPPKSVHVLSARPSFMPEGHEKAGKTDATAYAIYIFQDGWRGETTLRWLDWKAGKDTTQPELFGHMPKDGES